MNDCEKKQNSENLWIILLIVILASGFDKEEKEKIIERLQEAIENDQL